MNEREEIEEVPPVPIMRLSDFPIEELADIMPLGDSLSASKKAEMAMTLKNLIST